jgi:hypothetical protein
VSRFGLTSPPEVARRRCAMARRRYPGDGGRKRRVLMLLGYMMVLTFMVLIMTRG